MGWEEKSKKVSYKAFTLPLSFPTSKRIHIRVTSKEVLTSYLEQLSKTIYSCKINRRGYLKISGVTTKGQIISEFPYEIIVSPKIPTKNFQDFCPSF